MKTQTLIVEAIATLLGIGLVANVSAQSSSATRATPNWNYNAPTAAAPPAGAQPPPAAVAPALPSLPRADARNRPSAVAAKAKSITFTLPPGQPLAGAALERANRALLAEPRTPDPRRTTAKTSSLHERARANNLVGNLAPGVCVREAAIEVPKGQFTPGGLIVVRGCRLNDRPGSVHMMGMFPSGRVALEVVTWTDQAVAAMVPADLQGVLDQEVRFQLVLAQGQRSNERLVAFKARRETVELPARMVSNHICAAPQPSRCDNKDPRGVEVVNGFHQGDDSQFGRDIWHVSLGSSWALDRIDYDMRVGILETRVGARQPGVQPLEVDWRSVGSGRNIASTAYAAKYEMRLFATGPAGVALTTETR